MGPQAEPSYTGSRAEPPPADSGVTKGLLRYSFQQEITRTECLTTQRSVLLSNLAFYPKGRHFIQQELMMAEAAKSASSHSCLCGA